MTAAVYNFVLEQGTDKELSLIWKDSVGTPVDLTGYTARMQMRPSKSSETVLLDLSTENGLIQLGGVTGAISLIFTEALTNTLTRSGVYDLELNSGNKVTRLIEGEITLSKGVTRDE